MARAGEYRDRLEWQQQVKGLDSFGDRRAGNTFASQGHVWGVVEDLVGNREGVKGAEIQKTTATIRLRNYPAVRPGDKLQDLDGLVWLVKTVVDGDNEVSCDVER